MGAVCRYSISEVAPCEISSPKVDLTKFSKYTAKGSILRVVVFPPLNLIEERDIILFLIVSKLLYILMLYAAPIGLA